MVDWRGRRAVGGLAEPSAVERAGVGGDPPDPNRCQACGLLASVGLHDHFAYGHMFRVCVDAHDCRIRAQKLGIYCTYAGV